jgi:hypothetical protein
MKVDIRARVLWGDPLEEIRAEWLKKGAPAQDVGDEIRVAVQERLSHFRKKGSQDLLIGIACFLLAALSGWLHQAVYQGGIHIHHKAMALVLIALFVLPVSGLFFTIRGIRRIATGGSSEGAASDLSEFDQFTER